MTTAPMETDELMVVGKVVGVQGLKGELRILPLSDFPERFTKPFERPRPTDDWQPASRKGRVP